MPKNSVLNKAKVDDKDEFYTRLEDIENEMSFYLGHFKDKVVYCNCDDPRVSNFFKHFLAHFQEYGLKKLICTGFKFDGCGVKCVVDSDHLSNPIIEELEGNGSYDSDECLELMRESDIIVTNPPFSLFRDFLHTLMVNGKKFLIIGNINAITGKEIFPLFKENKLWVGCSSFNQGMFFTVPDHYEFVDGYNFQQEMDGKKVMRLSSICWYTNLDHGKRHSQIELNETYDPAKYPSYENIDGIEVCRFPLIPKDYDGVMGVPVTFIGKYNPDQFEIVDDKCVIGVVNGKKTYRRILIKRK